MKGVPNPSRVGAATPVARVESIEASHSAYFSKPEQFAATVLKLTL